MLRYLTLFNFFNGYFITNYTPSIDISGSRLNLILKKNPITFHCGVQWGYQLWHTFHCFLLPINTVFFTYTFICLSSTLPYTRKTHLPSYPGHIREPIESQWAPWDIKGSATFMIMVIYRGITGLIHYTRNSDVFTMELLHWLLRSDVTYAWWHHQMETLSALLAIFAGNSPVPGEFPSQRPVTRNFDVHFDLRLNKRLSKQWWGWWLETLSSPLWRHSNGASVALGLHWSRQWLFGAKPLLFIKADLSRVYQ